MRRTASAIGVLGLILSLLVLLPGSPVEAQANAVTVSEGESIQDAIDAAAPGTTITVEAGVYEELLTIETDGITLLGESGAIISPGDATDGCEFAGTYEAICIADGYFINALGESDATDTISDVTVSGFTFENVSGAAVGAVRGINIEISNNTSNGSGCEAFYIVRSENFTLHKNVVRNASSTLAFCNGMLVFNSTNGSVTKNSISDGAGVGLSIAGSTKVKVQSNKVRGNCGGIIVSANDGDPKSVRGVKVSKNRVSKNNISCQPFLAFGIDITIGGWGILVRGGDKVTVKNNKVTNNVVSDPAHTNDVGGILVLDALSPTGEFLTRINRVTVSGNRSTGNSVNGVDADIRLITESSKVKVLKNNCGVSLPNSEWCGG